ncbi:MAG: APC family permease, partial [Cutibacterium acnes]
ILMCVVTTTFVAFGSWVSIFPGTLEALVGMPHDFSKAQGVSYASFEALTLGTLAFIIVMALIGYWRGAPLRRSGISTESLNQTSTEVHRREPTCD